MRYRSSLIQIGCCAMLFGAGCQHHPRMPIDEQAHHASFKQRATQRAEGDWSLSALEDAAMQFNPRIRQQLEYIKLAEAESKSAGLWADPAIGFSLERMLRGEGSLWTVGSLISLELPISGAPKYRTRLAEGRVEVMKSAAVAAQWEVRADVRRAFVEYSKTIAKIQVLEEIGARLNELESRTDRIATVGEMTRISKRMFNMEAAMVRAELARMTAELDVMRLRVLELAGLPADVRIAPDVTFNFAFNPAAQVDHAHPELLMARAEYELTERELELEIRMQYPDLMLGAGPAFEGSDRSVMGEFGLPLPLWNANRGGIARALGMRDIERVRFEGTCEKLDTRAAASLAMIEAARLELDALEHNIVPLADAQIDDVYTMANVAKVEPFMILEALRQSSVLKLKLVDARAEHAMAVIELLMNTFQQGGEP